MATLTFWGGETDFNRLQQNDTIHSDTANAINLPRSDTVNLINRSRFISTKLSSQLPLRLPLPTEMSFLHDSESLAIFIVLELCQRADAYWLLSTFKKDHAYEFGAQECVG